MALFEKIESTGLLAIISGLLVGLIIYLYTTVLALNLELFENIKSTGLLALI
jgi:hypothetical protein